MGKKNRHHKKTSKLEEGSDAEVAVVETTPTDEAPAAEATNEAPAAEATNEAPAAEATNEAPAAAAAAVESNEAEAVAAPVAAKTEKNSVVAADEIEKKAETKDNKKKDKKNKKDTKKEEEPKKEEKPVESTEPVEPEEPKKELKPKSSGFFSSLIAKITGGSAQPTDASEPALDATTGSLAGTVTVESEEAKAERECAHRWDVIKGAYAEVIEAAYKEEAHARSTIFAVEYATYKGLKYDTRKLHHDCRQWYVDLTDAREAECKCEEKAAKRLQDEEANVFNTAVKVEKSERASILAESKRAKKAEDAAAKKKDKEEPSTAAAVEPVVASNEPAE